MVRLRVPPTLLFGGVSAALGAGVVAYVSNFQGFRKWVNGIMGWPDDTAQVTPTPAPLPIPVPLPAGISEDDVKAATQAVIAYIQEHATFPLQEGYVQGLVDTIQWNFRQDLINLTIELWSIPCIASGNVCSDQEAITGTFYISDLATRVAAKFNLTLSPNPLRTAYTRLDGLR